MVIIITIILLVAVGLWVNGHYKVVALNFNFSDKPEADGNGRLRVMAWNICSEEERFASRQDEQAQLIKAVDADVVCLSEFDMNVCGRLDSLLRGHYEYVYDNESKRQSGDILYSHLPICNVEVVAGVQSMCFEVEKGGKRLKMATCHLSSNNDSLLTYVVNDASRLKTLPEYYDRYKVAREKRCEEVDSILKRAPQIIVGDMNEFQHARPMQKLEEAGMRNGWWTKGNGMGITFHTGWMWLRIDHLYYSEIVRLRDIEIKKTELSDHYAMIGEVDL